MVAEDGNESGKGTDGNLHSALTTTENALWGKKDRWSRRVWQVIGDNDGRVLGRRGNRWRRHGRLGVSLWVLRLLREPLREPLRERLRQLRVCDFTLLLQLHGPRKTRVS